MTLQQAHNAALCIALAKKSFISELDRQAIDEVLDVLHGAIVAAFPQASENRYHWELGTGESDEGDESDEAYEVGEFDIEIEVLSDGYG